MRDEFTQETKDLLANRVGWKCSNPKCRKGTRGANTEKSKYVNIGVAAHICAASVGGPRYDYDMTSEERRSAENGIWLCQSCSKLIDSDVKKYTVKLLKEWKEVAEMEATKELEGRNIQDEKQKYNLIIKSFLVPGENRNDVHGMEIDVVDYFDGRFLKEGYTWDTIVRVIKDNINSYVNKNYEYLVDFSTHYSLAFILGRLMNPKAGIKVNPIQKTINGKEEWNIKERNGREYEKLSLREECVSDKDFDTAFVLSVTRNINNSVKEYIVQEKLPIGKIWYCGFDIPSIDSIIDGTHAWEVSKQISHCIEEFRSKKGIIHLFMACPIALMFNLGKMSLSYGRGRIYEYDLENRKTGTYYPALDFREEDWM